MNPRANISSDLGRTDAMACYDEDRVEHTEEGYRESKVRHRGGARVPWAPLSPTILCCSCHLRWEGRWKLVCTSIGFQRAGMLAVSLSMRLVVEQCYSWMGMWKQIDGRNVE